MKVIEALCVAAVGLASVGLDVIAFFVVVRVVVLHWRIRTLLAFDRAGQQLVDPLVTAVQRMIPPDWLGQEPRRTRLATAATLLVVAVCRFALSSTAHLVIIPL
jgi:hypothetical protein